jgi:hypothetical protein
MHLSTAPTYAPNEEREQRLQHDRRSFSVKTVLYGIFPGRRQGVRREVDIGQAHLDRYDPQLLYLPFLILTLSLVDAVLTLTLLPRGATEWNPLMRPLIETDVGLFVLVKTLVTGMGLTWLVALSRFRLFKVCSMNCVLGLILSGYGTLIAYESAMLLLYQ